MTWAGNSSIGSGGQEITESALGHYIVNPPDFDGGQAAVGYRLAAEGNSTCKAWSMDNMHRYHPVKRGLGASLLGSVVWGVLDETGSHTGKQAASVKR